MHCANSHQTSRPPDRAVGFLWLPFFLLLWCMGCSDEVPASDTGPTPDMVDLDGSLDRDAIEEVPPEIDQGDLQDLDQPVEEETGCGDDHDCPTGRYCNPTTGQCLVGCRTDDPATTAINEDTCTAEDECQVCSADTHLCEEIPGCRCCQSDEDCRSHQYCDVEGCACVVGCRIDDPATAEVDEDNCPLGQYCDPDDRTCHDEPCETDGDCETLQFCYLPDPESDEVAECRDGCRIDDPATTGTNEDNCVAAWGSPTNYHCDPWLRLCVPIICFEDEDCPEGQVCDVDQCRDGCRGDDDCPADQPCDPDTRTCRCRFDEDCDINQVCEAEHCVAACTTNPSCQGGYCNPLTGHCFPETACANETTEPNDSWPQATNVTGDYLLGALAGVDQDWYRLEGNVDETIEIYLSFDPGTIQVALYDDPAGTPLVTRDHTVHSTSGESTLSWAVQADGFLYLRLSGQGDTQDNGASCLAYALVVSRTPTAPCEPDDFEPNHTFDQAADLTEGWHNATVCPGEGGDFFTFDLPSNQRAEIGIQFVQADGDLDLELYDIAESLSQISAGSGDTEVVAVAPQTEVTTWYLRVVGHTPEVQNSYTISLFFNAAEACVPDRFEPEDDLVSGATDTQTPVGGSVSLLDLTACEDNQDWFFANGLLGGSLTVTVNQLGNACTTRVAIYSEDPGTGELGTLLAEIEDNNLAKEVVAVNLARTGVYYLLVETTSCQVAEIHGVGYGIAIEMQAPECSDPLESDDDRAQATLALGPTDTTYQTSQTVACPSNPDYFALQVGCSGLLSAVLTAGSNIDSIAMALESQGGSVIENAVSRSATSIGFVDERLIPATYYLHIYPIGWLPPAGQPYQLQVDLVCDLPECTDIGHEPNETVSGASLISTGPVCPAEGPTYCERICPDDVDYWLIPFSAPTDLQVNFAFDLTTPPTFVRLYEAIDQPGEDPALISRDYRQYTTSGFVRHEFAAAGQAIVLIQEMADAGVGSTGVGYALTVLQTLIDVCQPQSNTEKELANTLPEGGLLEARVCNGSALWYEVGPLALGNRSTFTLTKTGSAGQSIALGLFDQNLNLLQEQQTSPTSAVISRTDLAGIYYLKVQPATDAPLAGLPFTLQYVGETLPVCDDWAEPNETYELAIPIGAGTAVEDLLVCPGDADWFVFYLPGLKPSNTRDLTVTMTQLSTEAETTLELRPHNPENGTPGDVLASRTDAYPGKVISEEDLPANLYYLQVTPAGESFPEAGIPYALQIEVDQIACTDHLEPSDTLADAFPVSNSTTLYNLYLCPGDIDLVRLLVDADVTQLSVAVKRPAPSTEVMLYLLPEWWEELEDALVTVSGLGNELTLSYAFSEAPPGTYFLYLEADLPPATGELYDLEIDLVRPIVCINDGYEDDSVPEQARTVNPAGGALGGTICHDDRDYYRLDVSLGPVVVAGTVATAGDPLLVQLLDESLDEITSGMSFEMAGQPAGTYYLRVEETVGSPTEGGIPYTGFVTVDLDGCPTDRGEPNDSWSQTEPPLPSLPTSFAEEPYYLCGTSDNGDWDFYQATLVGTESLNVVWAHEGSDYPLRVQFLDSLGGTRREVENDMPFNSAWLIQPGAGTYYVGVHHEISAPSTAPEHGLPYFMAAVASDTSPCTPDGFEPANSLEEAADPEAGTNGGNLCPSDEDWYRLPIASTDGDLWIEVELPAGADYRVELFDALGAAVAYCAETTCSTELSRLTCTQTPSVEPTDFVGGAAHLLFVPLLSSEEVYLRITPDTEPPDEGWPYRFEYYPYEYGCLPDHLEPNDTLGTAAELVYEEPDEGGNPVPWPADGTLIDLGLCPGDQDYLVLTTPGDVQVFAFVSASTDYTYGFVPEGCTPPDPPPAGPTAPILLRLLDEGGTVLGTAHSASEADVLFASSSPAGEYTYYAHVQPEGEVPHVGQQYNLGYITSLPCADDQYEPGDTFADPVDGSTLQWRENPSGGDPLPPLLVLCNDNQDVIEFYPVAHQFCTLGSPECETCPEGWYCGGEGWGVRWLDEDINIEIRFEDMSVLAVAELFDDELTLIDHVDAVFPTPMVLSYGQYPAKTPFYVRVHKVPPMPGQAIYTLARTGTSACVDDDPNEPNDTIEEATPLALDTQGSGSLCPGDVDLWKVDVNIAPVRITVSGAVLDSTIRFLESDGVTLAPLNTDGWKGVVSSGGVVYTGVIDHEIDWLVVSITGGSTGSYTLEVTQAFCFADIVDSDGMDYEQYLPSNESQGEAARWLASSPYAVCQPIGEPADEDWFYVPLVLGTDDQYLRARIRFDSAVPPDFDLELWDDSTLRTSIDEETSPTGSWYYTTFVSIGTGAGEVWYYARVLDGTAPVVPFPYSLSFELWDLLP
ncbi:MAG: hypothetical protein JW797_17075 [Bradymonadales bacterium]|nr:hypothetical protein [Bradymonadales bacterium]